MRIDGQCHCGEIRYRAVLEDGAGLILCHCTDCQALTGTAFRTTVSVQRDTLEIDGTPTIYAKTGGSGRKRLQSFCPSCGSSLFSQGEGAETVGIRWGTIRQRMALSPRKQIWRRSAAPWVCAFAEVPALPEE
jgi:hypothetical protein